MLKPTSTAASPTKLWRIATSSGIAVIATRARHQRADDRRPSDADASSVGDPTRTRASGRRPATAIAMPDDAEEVAAPRGLLLRQPAEARMKRTPATRYVREVASHTQSVIGGTSEHALGDEEAAGDVDRGERDGDAAPRTGGDVSAAAESGACRRR